MAVAEKISGSHELRPVEAVAELIRLQFGDDEQHGLPPFDEELARQVIAIALRNKLLKPVLRELESRGVSVPEDLKPEVAVYLRRSMNRNAAVLTTLREVTRLLSDAGVTHAAFKGPVRQIALQQDIFERPVADADILVRSADFSRATALLCETGYAVPHMCDSPWWRYFLGEHALFPNDRERTQIDLHHRLQHPSCPRPRHEEEVLMADPEWIEVGGQKIRTFGKNGIFLHTVVSIIKGLMNREPTGSHVLDLGRQIRSASSEQRAAFMKVAAAQRLTKSYAVARRAVRSLTGVEADPAPEWIMSDDALLGMLLTPADPAVRWPERRYLLWHLVDGRSACARAANYAREFAWWAAAEATRRTHDVS